MKTKIVSAFLMFLLLFSLFPTASAEKSGINVVGIDEKIDSIFEPLVNFMSKILFWDPIAAAGIDIGASVPFVILWLAFGAIFFTLKMGFINICGFRHAIDLVRGKYSDPNDKGEVSHFKALATALSATVGLGNIAGVAIAIAIGGAGATFWMILAGLLGMTTKFVECTLSLKYRVIGKNGEVSGGPMYYLEKVSKYKKLGKVLGILFAFLCIGGSFGIGNMFQANQAYAQLSGQFPSLEGMGVYFGIGLAVLVGIVIIGGIKSIANVASRVVPIMAVIYVSAALFVILANVSEIGSAFSMIINGAFAPHAIEGGIIGVLIQGFRRAAFSNEAGIGSAPIAHSAAKTKEPVSEGMVALLEPFIDTVVICTMTALVLIFTGYGNGGHGLEGAQLTSAAFGSVIPWFPPILVLVIFLFAFSTIIAWSYYGVKAWSYLFGEKTAIVYKTIFLLVIIVGSSSTLGAVIDFSDMMILAMAVPNIIGLLLLSPEVKRDLKNYLSRLKSGEIKKHK